LLDEHCRRQADHGRTLWTLIMLSEWLDWVAKEEAARSSHITQPAT
jgi:asparagine synthase (glutamine-hydrolysing)